MVTFREGEQCDGGGERYVDGAHYADDEKRILQKHYQLEAVAELLGAMLIQDMLTL